MSLPRASKEISDHPGKNSVTSPVVAETMQKDVDRKMRFYGVIQAFREGKMPDNAQIDETLRYIEQTTPFDTTKLSADGKKLVSDTRDIIETARLMVKEKNADELFQNFVYHTTGVDPSRAKVDTTLPVEKEQLKADGQQAVVHLRTLLTLFLTNAEARKLLSDVGLIGRDMFATAAAKAAEAARPDPEALTHVDDAAEADTWIGADGQKHGSDSTPALQMTVPGLGSIIQHPKEPLGEGAVLRDANGKERTGGEALQEAKERAPVDDPTDMDQVKGKAMGAAQAAAEPHVRDVQGAVESQPDGDADAQADAGKKTLKEKFSSLKESMSQRIPQEHKDKLGENKDKVKDFLNDQFPEERRDQFVWRMKKVIVECQKHDDYQEAINWFLNFLETYSGHSKSLAGTGATSVSNVAQDPALTQAMRELRTLLERFANGASLTPINDAANALYDDASSDENLKNWFRKLDAYMRRTLLEPGFVLQPQFNQQWAAIRDEGKGFFDHKYKAHKDNLFNQIQSWFTAFGDDPLNMRFGQDWANLTKDLLFDDNGQLSFKPHLWNDIRRVILPAVINQVGYVPIPRIEYTDHMIDLVIENLTLQGANLFPNIVELEAHNYVKFSPYKNIEDVSSHEFTLTFGQIQADMRDVAFYFKKKSGFPKLQDAGLMDILLGGSGLTVTVHLASAGKDTTSVFHVKRIIVKIDSINFSIRDSKHDLLYKLIKPLVLTGLVKKQIQKAIEQNMRTALEYVDGQLVGVRDRMNEAKATDGQSRTDVLKEIFAKKTDQAKEKKEKTDSKFQIATNRNSLLIPDHGYKGGWINKQADREKAAVQGEGWHSPAFSIVTGPVKRL